MRKSLSVAGLMLFAALLFIQPSRADSSNFNNYQLTGSDGTNITFSLPQTLTPSSVTWNNILVFHNVAGTGYGFNTVLIGNSGWNGTNYWASGSMTKTIELYAPGLFTFNSDGTVTLGTGTFTVGDYHSFGGGPKSFTLTIVDPPGGPVTTPEPASLILLGLGSLALGSFRRRKTS